MPKRRTGSRLHVLQPAIEDLTLDVCVLMSGSGISDAQTCTTYGSMSLDLMKRMISDHKYRLAMDSKKKIRAQYDDKLKPQTYAHFFVRQMASMEKVTTIPWRDINKGVRVKLERRGFTRNSEDYKFVVTASATCCGKLITHERHFFGVQDILSRVGVIVLAPGGI